MFKVFVYGTLKQGGRLNDYLETATMLGTASLKGYEMYNLGWYPGIVPGEGTVEGEVYEVGERLLGTLDGVEGVPFLYQRVTVEVEDANGNKVEVMTYVYTDVERAKRRTKVESGVWAV